MSMHECVSREDQEHSDQRCQRCESNMAIGCSTLQRHCVCDRLCGFTFREANVLQWDEPCMCASIIPSFRTWQSAVGLPVLRWAAVTCSSCSDRPYRLDVGNLRVDSLDAIEADGRRRLSQPRCGSPHGEVRRFQRGGWNWLPSVA